MKKAILYLEHILQECEYIVKTSKGLEFEDFDKNETLIRAFTRSLEIIGEATKNIPKEFKEKYSEIPWKEIAGMRDVLIHEYFDVNHITLWETINQDIPMLQEKIEEILKAEKQ